MNTATSTDEAAAEARASFSVGGGPRVAAAARSKVEALKTRLGPVIAGDVELLISELVTNSYRHSGHPAEAIGVEVHLEPEKVRCEIVDQGKGFAAAPVPESERGEGGWGLLIVDRLADRWGVRSGPPTQVWFEIGR